MLIDRIWQGTSFLFVLEVFDWEDNVKFALQIYRVSRKSFPDYKHLLQENYVEYKHFSFKM
jgi:hypothetical protein